MPRRVPVALVIVFFCLGTFATSALAGFEPSPFQPEINQLGAAQNILESIKHTTDKTLDNPPIEGVYGPNLTGALNKLKTTTKKLNNVAGFISSNIDAVLGLDPSPFWQDLIPALQGVNGAAQAIVYSINAFLDIPPDPIIPVEFTDALKEGVLFYAEGIVSQTANYIASIEGQAPECTLPCIEHATQESCENTLIDCVWVEVPGASGYCCNQ